MTELERAIDRAADSDRSVLIWDDDPVERRTIAATIHERSARRTKPFLSVPCDSPEHFEGRVLGHERAPLAGAPDPRPGILEMAHGGTVFVDDVAMLGLLDQWILYSASERGLIYRLGAATPVKVDVRYVFATGADLGPLVTAGKFRKDLFGELCRSAICVRPTRDFALPEPPGTM